MEIKDCWMQSNCKKFPDCPQPLCVKLFKIDALCKDAMLTQTQRRYVQLRLDADGADREAFQTLKDIEKNIEDFTKQGNNLYIHSQNCGNGKTAWSLRLLNSYFNSIWYRSDLVCRGLFINVPRFLIALKDNISHENPYITHIKENVMIADLVVFDEVGVKALTAFEHEHILNTINARIDAGKSNIYTSNLNPIELAEAVGDRLYSRIVNYSINIEFTGRDKRGLNK